MSKRIGSTRHLYATQYFVCHPARRRRSACRPPGHPHGGALPSLPFALIVVATSYCSSLRPGRGSMLRSVLLLTAAALCAVASAGKTALQLCTCILLESFKRAPLRAARLPVPPQCARRRRHPHPPTPRPLPPLFLPLARRWPHRHRDLCVRPRHLQAPRVPVRFQRAARRAQAFRDPSVCPGELRCPVCELIFLFSC